MNPNIASGSSSTPNMLDEVGSPFTCSNMCPVGPSPTQVSGTGTLIAGQASMSVPQISVPFEQLGPRSMSTSSGPMGTDYKP